MKNLKVIWVVFLMLLLTLSACSNSESISGSSDGKVNLTWWSHDGPTFVKANKKFIKDYEAANPNVKINLQIYPYDAFVQKLKAAYASKNPPDMAQVFGSWVPEYTKNDLLSPVPDEMKDWVKSGFYEPALGAYTHDEVPYGIPQEYNIENGGVLANPEMFKNAGLDYPKTWDELITDAQKLTVTQNEKIQVKGFDFVNYDNITFTFLSLILQQKGEYWTKDNQVNFSTPEAVKAMNELKKFVTDYKVTDLRDFGGKLDTSDLFFKNKAAMVIRGPWSIAEGKENYQTEKLDYIPMPSFTENPAYFAAESGWGEIVAKSSKHQEEAWKFIKYMTEKENAKYFNITTFTVPANKDAAQDPEFLKALPKMKASIDVLPYGMFIGIIDTDFLKKTINDNFQLIAVDKVSVEDGLKKIETTINQMLNK
ncbi:ABC transporter substrate-binding protein [Neobacillus sp. NPDC058068]|uniref:ABC transporter substrate-binding protein n=1 Tax=Neobacillus sp. NPDC058068 TaxID=3346325 RepID=UPI0036DD6971